MKILSMDEIEEAEGIVSRSNTGKGLENSTRRRVSTSYNTQRELIREYNCLFSNLDLLEGEESRSELPCASEYEAIPLRARST